MGSPTYGYKHVLIHYMEYGEREKKWNFTFSDDEYRELFDMDIKELEKKALSYYKNNYPLAILNLGYSIKQFVEDYHDYCDMMNAFCASMSMLYDLFGISDEPDVNIPWPDIKRKSSG